MTEICGQADPVFARQINSSDGLSSGEYNYFLHRDTYGYLWISAMDGLNRYDGHIIKQYYKGEDSPHELWDNNIQSDIVEDGNGNLWFTTIHGLNVYDRSSDLVKPVIPPGPHPKILDGSSIMGYCSDRKELLLHGPAGSSGFRSLYVVDLETRSVTKVEADSTLTGIRVVFLGETETGWEYLTVSGNRLNHLEGNKSGIRLVRSSVLSQDPGKRRFELKVLSEEYVLLAHSEGLFQIDRQSGEVEDLLERDSTDILPVVDMEPYQDSLLLLASRNDGLFFLNLKTKKLTQLSVREGGNLYQFSNGVSRLYADRNGNFWLSTDGDGIFQINLEKDHFQTFPVSEHFPQLQESVTGIDQCRADGTIWVGTMRSIYAIDSAFRFLPELTRTTTEKLNVLKGGARVFCLLAGSNGELLIGTENGVLFQRNRSAPFQKIEGTPAPMIATSFHHLQDGRIMIGVAEGTPKILTLHDLSVSSFLEAPRLSSPMHLLELGTDGIVVGNSDKRLYYAPNFHRDGSFADTVNLEISGQIASIVGVGQGKRIFVGTEEGIRELTIEDRKLILSKELIYKLRGLKSLVSGEGAVLWLGTNRGIIKLDLESGETEKYSVVDGLAADGASFYLPAIVRKEYLIFPSQNGVSILQGNQIRPIVKPYIPRVTDILVNQEKVSRFSNDMGQRVSLDGGEPLEFKPSQRSLTFFFSGMNLHDPSSQEYFIRLIPGDASEKKLTDDFKIGYANLDPGTYTLEITTGENASALQSLISFQITPYWYERSSVQIGGILLIMLILAASALYQIRNLRRDRELAQTKAANFKLDLEVKRVQNDVLRQQMNPHFLNNALNVVLARTRDNKALYHFVGKVSGLVRDIFNFAWKEQISLQEELVMLERYLHAEKSIHGLELTWSVQMPEGENSANIDVPPMILQPFAENALKHGFIAAGRKKGHISIDMEIDEDRLIISLADNGGGRNPNQASKHFLDPDKPSAIKVVRERLQLLNSGIGTEIAKLEIEDLKNEQGSATGTRVILTLPV